MMMRFFIGRGEHGEPHNKDLADVLMLPNFPFGSSMPQSMLCSAS